MNAATEAGLVGLLTADRSIPNDRIPLIVEFAKGRDLMPARQSEEQDYFTVSQACDWFQCCRMTLYRLEKSGELQCVYLRGKKLFEREALIKALKK